MTFYKRIDIPIYEQVLHLFIYDLIEEYHKKLKKMGLDESLWPDGAANGSLSQFKDADGGAVFMLSLNSEYLHVGTVAHECYHFVQFMTEHLGMTYKKDDPNEAHSYLMGFITKEVMKHVETFKHKSAPADNPVQEQTGA